MTTHSARLALLGGTFDPIHDGHLDAADAACQALSVDQVLLVGFTTYTGHVTAAREWDGPAERRAVRPARVDSYEHLYYRSGLDRFYLPLQGPPAEVLREPMLERAIGVN